MYVNVTSEDRFHDHCGIFGVYRHPDASRMTYLGLYALQHRGQESAGICTSDGEQLNRERGMGYVSDIFTENVMGQLTGNRAIGHVRYSTAGESLLENAQPILIDTRRGAVALCHNGNIANAQSLREELKDGNATFHSSSDTEIILHLFGRSPHQKLEDALAEALGPLEGAYSLLLLTRDQLVAVRDPAGFRPLCIGKVEGATLFASETCALDLVGAEYQGEVAPGTMVICDEDGMRTVRLFPERAPSHCVFEQIYFARPDSLVFGHSVYAARYALGRQLARETGVEADVVVPVPDSGVTAALGFAAESGIPFEFGLIRNHYIGRTFIEPKQAIRQFGVRVKLNPVKDILTGRRILLIDDSIVRGNTSQKIVRMIRSAGAAEIHLRISSPPIISPCFYGIDTPTRQELIASRQSVEEIERFLGVDSLAYLSLEGLLTATGDPSGDRHCCACFTGNYSILTTEMMQNLRSEELAAK